MKEKQFSSIKNIKGKKITYSENYTKLGRNSMAIKINESSNDINN